MLPKRFGLLALTLPLLVNTGCGNNEIAVTSAVSPTCAFHSGALPVDTLPPGTPHGAAIPIDHIVVLMQENHSFDNYFAHLPHLGKADVDGLPANASNPDSN